MVNVSNNWVEFSFYRPKAVQVHIVGDFNQWRQGELPMVRTAQGYWIARVRLPGGLYKFRYWSDGQWFADYAAFGLEYGPFGPDSVVMVADAKPELAKTVRPSHAQLRPMRSSSRSRQPRRDMATV